MVKALGLSVWGELNPSLRQVNLRKCYNERMRNHFDNYLDGILKN